MPQDLVKPTASLPFNIKARYNGAQNVAFAVLMNLPTGIIF